MQITYFVPKNVSMRFEIVPGFGLRELFLCGIALGVGGGLALAAGMFALPTPLRLAFTIVPPGIMFFITQPGLSGESLYDMLGHYKKFSMQRKLYINNYEGGNTIVE